MSEEENRTPKPPLPLPPRKRINLGHWGWDVAIAALAIGVTGFLASGYLSYWAGTRGHATWIGTFYGELYLLTLVMAAVCGLIVRLFIYWGPVRPSIRALRTALAAVLFVGLGARFYYSPPGDVSFTKGFREKMRSQGDLRAIRAWYATVEGVDLVLDDPEDWPPSIRELSPARVFIREDGSNTVRLDWAGGFLNPNGLVVGPETMPIPKSSEEQYVLEVAPGAYVYHDME